MTAQPAPKYGDRPRSVRVDDPRWYAALAACRRLGTTVSDVVRDALDAVIEQAGDQVAVLDIGDRVTMPVGMDGEGKVGVIVGERDRGRPTWVILLEDDTTVGVAKEFAASLPIERITEEEL